MNNFVLYFPKRQNDGDDDDEESNDDDDDGDDNDYSKMKGWQGRMLSRGERLVINSVLTGHVGVQLKLPPIPFIRLSTRTHQVD